MAWRTIIAVESNVKYSRFMPSIKEYKDKMEKALIADSENVIEIIKTMILQKPGAAEEPRAFFTKMIADYYRY